MKTIKASVAVIGAGPAGLAAACKACENTTGDVIVIERANEAGGILNQCIHNGFGLHHFNEELTGPEYAQRFITMLNDTRAKLMTDTIVLQITQDKKLYVANPKEGMVCIEADSIVLAMGCRERTRGAIGIPGDRPAGVFTAGTAQRYLNMEGYLVGKRVVILGSGDIGLIMARRMTLEGAKVLACVELCPYSNGLNRNIVQCLNDYDIPLYLSHTITDIRGEGRVQTVTVAKVDQNTRKPIPGSEIVFDCDTVLLSVGLIPENELSRAAGIEIDPRTNGPVVFENMETSVPGIFGCGNVVHVHDLVDFVTAESERAGVAAAKPRVTAKEYLSLKNGDNVGYTVPQRIRLSNVDKSVEVFFRVRSVIPSGTISVTANGTEIAHFAREHMTPGEMQHIALPKVLLEKANGGEITVSIKEAAK